VSASDKKTDDRSLLAAISRGSAAALEQLYARHHLRVFRFITRIVNNQAIAEELMNEVFLSAWQGAASYEGRSEATTWLLSIAHNKAISSRRRRREIEDTDGEMTAGLLDHGDTPDVTALKTDKARIMRMCINSLSHDHRTILDLVYYQECSVSEAAEILAIPENTVKTRMFHARKKLSEQLQARGIDRGWP
jgi:RNA polymerase sigma-70 factor, ECF subfamily